MVAVNERSRGAAAVHRHGQSKFSQRRNRKSRSATRVSASFPKSAKKELVMERKMLRIASVVFVASVLIGVVGCAKPKVQVQVSKTTVSQGEEVRVNWTSKDAKQVTLNGNQVDKNGAQVFTPDNTTTYTAVASRGKKEARDSKVVSVTPKAARP